MDAKYQAFGQWLMEARYNEGFATKSSLARALQDRGAQVGPAAVGHWESGVRRPGVDSLLAVFLVLRTPQREWPDVLRLIASVDLQAVTHGN